MDLAQSQDSGIGTQQGSLLPGVGKGHFGVKDEWLSCVEGPERAFQTAVLVGQRWVKGLQGTCLPWEKVQWKIPLCAGRDSSQSLGSTPLLIGSHRGF